MNARIAEIGEAAVQTIERQDWLDTIADRGNRAIQAAVDSAGVAGKAVKNFLHGTWLGHPLHPVLTDMPIGAWTAAVMMDARDAVAGDGRGRGAERAIAIGVAGAAGAALAGVADWHHTDGAARRTGVVHAVLNTTALALYVSSLVLRRRGAVPAGRAVGFLGFGTMLASAYLGGNLVYRHRVGVDHAERDGADDFTRVLREDELAEGRPRRVQAGGVRVLLVRRGAVVQAIGEVCAHMGGPLAEGRLEDDSIVCPWHGSRFALDDGRVLDGPAAIGQPCWETRVRGGFIEIRRARTPASPVGP